MAWEGGTRVPLIVKAPAITPRGAECDEPVLSIDFFPTLLELVGGASRKVDGVSLAPLLRTPDASLPREAIFWHYPHYNVLLGVPHSSVRRGRYKLIEFFEDSRIELYDLAEDVGEQSDLASRNPQTAAELAKLLRDWREEVAAQLPVKK